MNDVRNPSPLQKVHRRLSTDGPVILVKKVLGLTRGRVWLARRNCIITMGRRLSRRPVVHVVGDSHVFLFEGVSPFVATWLGGATAYNLGRAGSTTRSGDKLEKALKAVDRSKDVLLVVVGEIDCRIHIYDQYMRRNRVQSIESLIDDTIDTYGSVLQRIRSRGYRVVVHSVSAAAREDNRYHARFYADEATRSRIVQLFNQRLERWCAANDLEYFDVYRLVRDDDGFLKEALTDDGIHLSKTALPVYQEWAAGL